MHNVHRRAQHFCGVVVETFGNSILARVDEDDRSRIGASLAFVSTAARLRGSTTDFMSGDEIIVFFNGKTLDTYPAQIGGVFAIVLASPPKKDAWASAARLVLRAVWAAMQPAPRFQSAKRLFFFAEWYMVSNPALSPSR